MAKVELEVDVTEHHVTPNHKIEKNIFVFEQKGLVIRLEDEEENVVELTELSRRDAVRLAKLILHEYEAD